jgi:hypothetical protein
MNILTLGRLIKTTFNQFKNDFLPALGAVILLNSCFLWLGYKEYQFASNCNKTSAVVIRVERDSNKFNVIVEYNDHITGLPTEGIIRKLFRADEMVPNQRTEILYVSGMYRVYSPEHEHPNDRMVVIYGFCEVSALLLTYKVLQRFKNETVKLSKLEAE